MNRVILIGNGFDLAHGLKTSYQDFINDFWEKKLDTFLKILRYKNNLGIFPENSKISQTTEGNYRYNDDDIRFDFRNTYSNTLTDDVFDNYSGYERFFFVITQFGLIETSNSVRFNNNFLGKITEKEKSQNWVNIEHEYYYELCKLLDATDTNFIKKLNNEFSYIQSSLYSFLINQKEVAKLNKVETNIFSPVDSDYFLEKPFNEKLVNILFLSFNYTNTECLYLEDKSDYQVNHIHGELWHPNNPIIFGYGDEIDEKYKKLEQMNNNDYLLYIKSFMYSKTNNYQNMLRFINSEKYEVFIMGHSCGNSDRTLLNTLFENENCLSIKIFFHNKDGINNNYLDLYMNISRNFTNKKKMREIIVPLPGCVSLS